MAQNGEAERTLSRKAPSKGILEWHPDTGEMQDTGGVYKVTMSSLQGQGQSLITDKTAKDPADGE